MERSTAEKYIFYRFVCPWRKYKYFTILLKSGSIIYADRIPKQVHIMQKF